MGKSKKHKKNGGSSGKQAGVADPQSNNNDSDSSRPPPRSSNRKRKKRNHVYRLADDEKLRASIEADGTRTVVDMAADGNCLFRSLADQLFGDHGDAHDGVRDEICDYLAGHEADFAFFLDLDDETTAGDDASTYDAYVEQMRQDGEWGGHLELVAAARLYRRTVTIYSSSLASLQIDHDATSQAVAGPPLRVSYHDNDHYNSIRETGRASPPPLPIRTYIKEDKDGAMAVATTSTEEGFEEAIVGEFEPDSTEAVEVPAAEEVPEAGAAGPTTTKKKQKKAKPGGLCPCGSGEKYRKCCKEKDKRAAHQERVKVQKTLKEETESTTGQAEVAMDGDFRKLTI
jgi:OTU domain-containing protein 3